MYRKTYAEINHEILTQNIQEIKKAYPEYKYYIGVVKNNAYHHGIKVVKALKEGGINYFAVSSLEEALEIRKYNIDLPILILEPIKPEYVYDCINQNIAITVENLEDLKSLNEMDFSFDLKIHLKVDSGMNRLGFKSSEELESAVKLIREKKHLYLEGIYTHFATSGVNDKQWDNQLETFKDLTQKINLNEIPIVHLGRSLTLVNHEKIPFCNGVRLGIIMYGFSQSQKPDLSIKGKIRSLKQKYNRKKYQISQTTTENNLKLHTAFSLYSNVMSIRKVAKGEVVGYNATYKVKESGYIATIPIGYADGVDKKFQKVWINNQKYPIVADTMDMILVFADNSIKKGMKVEIFGQNIPIQEVTKNINQNAYHLFNQIQDRVPRIHIIENEREETKY